MTAHVEIKKKTDPQQTKGVRPPANLSEVVLWFKPLDRIPAESQSDKQPPKRLQLIQKNKSFQPHVLIVPIGTVVDFSNRDPFFHNVFSLFDGKRFDLGLYEAGATKSVRFDRLGVSFLFCNIHPAMSAVVIAVDTPYYGVSNCAGNITIPNLPDGEYELHVWYERSLAEDLKILTRTVTISSATKDLGTISVPEDPSFQFLTCSQEQIRTGLRISAFTTLFKSIGNLRLGNLTRNLCETVLHHPARVALGQCRFYTFGCGLL